jgi:hypothetical protein
MAISPTGAAQVPLTVWGSWVTEVAPEAVPENISPGCGDVSFFPGGVESRPCLQKIFNPPIEAGGTIVYGKSFVTPTKTIKNLYLSSAGNFYVEDLTNAPGVATLLFTTTPSSFCKSLTQFGREYIAISDGLHGADVPLQYDGTLLRRVTCDGPAAPPVVASQALAPTTLATVAMVTLTRAANFVSGTTSTAHNLKVGYQAQIGGMTAAQVGGGISTIAINNENNPGLALVTTAAAHGLAPGNQVNIQGVATTAVGGAITHSINNYGVITLTMTNPHGLSVGSIVIVNGTNAPAYGDGQWIVSAVPSDTEFSYLIPDTSTYVESSNMGTVSLVWPSTTTGNPDDNLYLVDSCPSSTTFYVDVAYTDGTWTGGTVSFAWDGTFYITATPSATEFEYRQYGPNATATDNGTVTPFGQAAPGLHLCQVLWLTDQGYVTAPSPPVTFIANGGQYLAISDIPVGPSYVKARVLAFTGAQPNVPGTLPPFFYIPATPQTEGQIVGTSTVINDNVTTTALLDFSDNTLYAALGISIPGNTLANQIKLDGALGFGAYGSRLLTCGQRNTIQNLLNMGFGGGTLSGSSIPLGWTSSGAGVLVGGRFSGFAWSAAAAASLTQGFYEDAYGDPIALANTVYSVRYYLTGNGTVSFTLGSASLPFSTSVNIVVNGAGWYEATFPAATPLAIPTDFTYAIAWVSGSFTAEEGSVINSQQPYTDIIANGSYVNNPEGFDGDTGEFGANNDPAKIMDFANLRETLYLITQAPSGRLHETNGSGVTEPNGWVVDEVAADCGILSAFSLTHSQADDTTASGGDNWFAWPTQGGGYIFGGGLPEKISQEIQPNWYDPTKSDTTIQINMAVATTAWGLNDPVQRLLMFGLPIGDTNVPNKIYVLNYRNLNSASATAGSPPFHPSLAGKLIATDNSRKWAPWNMPMMAAARMYRQAGSLSLVMIGGAYGNVYLLNPAYKTDDDFGQVYPFYTTYFFLDPDKAQALQLKGLRILMAYVKAYIQGTGQVTLTYYPDSLQNPWPLTTIRALTNVFFDREFGGGQCTGDRIAIKISSSPTAGTDNGFVVTRLTAFIKDAKLSIRGAAQ